MRHIGLFAGIGGFELAARWMGWNTIAWSEWDPFCQKVLSYHFPEAKGYGDIKQADFTEFRGQCDILTGGFPCQPYSVAGKRLGKEDERHLWPEMLRAIREIRPRWIIGENVRGLLSWNEGLVFEEVCTDLESEGYEVQAFIIPAAGVNAPHRRERAWIVAQSNNSRRSDGFVQVQTTDAEISKRNDYAEFSNADKWIIANASGSRKYGEYRNDYEKERKDWCGNDEFNSICKLTSNAENSRLSTCHEGPRQEQFRRGDERDIIPNHWENFPTIAPVCGGDDGLPSELDGITFPKWRKESIKAYGNAIVPQVAYQLFQAIDFTESLVY